MRIWKVTPIVAILALAACGDQQTAETEEPTPPPAAEAPAEESPAETPPTAEAMPEAPAAMPEDLPRTASAPPTPSSVFEDGADALGDIDDTIQSVFADAPFNAGDYRAEGFDLSINEDGDFTLEIAADGRVLDGDLRIYGDMLTMSNIEQETNPGEFPMTCQVSAAPDGFELTADGPSCGMFDGLVFARAE